MFRYHAALGHKRGLLIYLGGSAQGDRYRELLGSTVVGLARFDKSVASTICGVIRGTCHMRGVRNSVLRGCVVVVALRNLQQYCGEDF